MTTNFLQRFKGKTQQMGKDGLIDVVREAGSTNNPAVIVQTNIDFKSRQAQPNKIARHGSMEFRNEPKNEMKKTVNQPQQKLTKPKEEIKQSPPHNEMNPFYVANPFRMDDEEPDVPFQLPKPKAVITPPPVQKPNSSMEKQPKQTQQQFKQTSKSYASRGASCDTKKTNGKEWVKLGGLGANIGGEQWQEKKKKLDKMQEFAEQVKAANAQKATKQKKPTIETDEEAKKKQNNPRNKALEYCKSIPKPPKKPPKREQQVVPLEEIQPVVVPEQLSQLQLYERRHQELQKLLNEK